MRVRRNSASAVILLGLPGSGKGTQSRGLSEALSVPVLSTGDMLRREVTAGTRLGKTVAGLMDQGMLVGDDLVNKAVRAHVSRRDCANGFVLDGYPRTVAQARFLDACLAELEFGAVRVLWLDIAPTEVEARLLRRLQCPKCGRTYCSDSSPTGVCELDGSPLTHRGDDNVNVIRERLSQYEHNTAPLLDYYSGPRLRHISASGAPRQVAEFLLAAVNDYALETRAARSAHYAHAAV